MTTMIMLAMTLPLAVTTPDIACGLHDDRPDVRISLETFGALPPLRIATILEEVDRIWGLHDVRLAWRLQAPASGSTPRDTPPVDVWVQLVESLNHAHSATAHTTRRVLGIVRFTDGRPLRLVRIPVEATISVLRDAYSNQGMSFHESLALHTRVLERALARAIAHELGHILLRSASHMRSGLMRANLRAPALMTTEPVDLALDPALAVDLRARLRASRETCADLVERR